MQKDTKMGKLTKLQESLTKLLNSEERGSYITTQDQWIELGIKMGWSGPPVCISHDGLPMSLEEEENEELDDICIVIMRPYEDEYHKVAVEENHSPSLWRK